MLMELVMFPANYVIDSHQCLIFLSCVVDFICLSIVAFVLSYRCSTLTKVPT